MSVKYSLKTKTLAVLISAALIISSAALGFSALAAGVVNTGDGNGKTSLTFSPQGGGLINYTIGTRTSWAQSKYINSAVPIGTEVILTAEKRYENQTFLYWYNAYTDRVVSYEPTIKFKLVTKTQINAVFITPLDGYHYVSYLNYAGSILKSGDFKLGSVVTPPQEMSLPGFTFVSWDHSISDVTINTDIIVVRPLYTLNQTDYTVSFTNTENVEGAGTYNNYDTVSIKADEKNSSGETFSCWKNSEGAVVSYERNYSFRINYNDTFTAVYGEDVTPEPVTRMSNVVTDAAHRKITFFAERSIPEGYTLLQHGILMSSSLSSPLILSAVTMGESAAVKRGTGVSNESCGTYALSKEKAVSGTIYYARSYAVCEDPTGTQYVFYGNTVTASV